MGYGVKNAAIELINSEHWYGRGPERSRSLLEEPGWLNGYLERFDLVPPSPPSARQVGELVALRTLLRRMATSIAAERTVEPAHLEELNRVIARAPIERRVVASDGGFRVELVPATPSWRTVPAAIATSFAELLELGELERIKLCANDECGWAFYDESKNRRRRWCAASPCGNADKVRRFRARQRAART